MDPLSSPLLWTAEDNFLLKSAIENGASLTSLARGAVSFSRRYSFIELKERWHSMLFDPDVSKEAAASMAKLELAKYKGKKIKKAGLTDVAVAKRKTQNIRSHYYAMRKRIRKEASFMNKDETDTDKQSDGDSFAELEVNVSSSSSNQGDSTFVFDCGNEAQSSGAAQGSHP